MNLKRFLSRRMRNIGVSPKDAARWANRIQFQIESMGPEGAVLYLKRIGDCIVWASTGSGLKPEWVKTRNRFPILFDGIESYPLEVKLRLAKVARSIRLETPTRRQVRKVISGVICPYAGTLDGLERARSLIHRGTLVLSDSTWDAEDYPTVLRQFRKIQSVSGKTPLVSAPPLEDSLRILAAFPEFQALPGWEQCLYPLSPMSIKYALDRIEPAPRLVGEIHAAQEGGAKLRMFASPYTVIQSLLSPIHNFFDGYRSQLPSDCTYDQLAGARWAQASLAMGKTVHSVDLSTATCRFPLDIQLSMATLLGLPPEHISALRLVSNGEWAVGRELRGPFSRRTLQWVVGQPLGIRPSMSMFSLAHNLLLVGIALEKGIDWEESFRVLGDDVVINDDYIASEYRSVMDGLGVPISYEKSHSSPQYAEFAGASITPTLILRPGQWRQISHDNALSMARELGTKLEGEVAFHWLQAQKLFLFRSGLYDPPSSTWSFWLKANTLFSEDNEFPEFKSTAPYWYYTTLEKVQKFFIERGWIEPGFIPESPNILRILSFLPAEHCAHQVSRAFATRNISYVVSAALGYNASYFNGSLLDGEVPSPESVLSWAKGIIDRANAMLYQPPANSGERLNVVLSKLLKALESAAVPQTV